MSSKMKRLIKIKIQERLDLKWQEHFEGMSIKHRKNQTIIEGTTKDQAHLFGILNMIRDLNLKLISVIVLEGEKFSRGHALKDANFK